ncbi:MAG: response regulator transcription factor [Novosphingobium sp.]|nr:response regulator transcription factor [Novosphingobium sp.]
MPEAHGTLRLLHVEDDDFAAGALAEVAREGAIEVVRCVTAAAGVQLAAAEAFDVIVFDRMLPDGDGAAAIAQLRALNVTTPVLVLSALGRSADHIEGLDAGADDYLGKPYDPNELVARVRALDRRHRKGGHPAVLLHGRFECHVKARTAYRCGQHIALSPKEFSLFLYFMTNVGGLVTREMLLRDVWKLNFDPTTNVVDVNLSRLRKKLEEGFDTPALENVWGNGYRLTTGD